MPAQSGGKELAGEVRLAYRLWQPEKEPQKAPWLILLHGSPGGSHDFNRLAPELAQRFRVVAPDLPGFGASSHDVPDYSIAAHAAYARALLARLGAEKAHVLGFSMGGGVAIEMARQAPGEVASLTLLSGLGVQEVELLGDYRLNHAVHGLQLGLLWLAKVALPHFGLFDDAVLGIPYARNFYDSDQRPLRPTLERLQVPVLILHGDHDVLVPYSAALEHHRLVPQSELLTFPGENHFMVFAGGERLSAPILDFLGRVEAGQATTRATATPERLAAASKPFDPKSQPPAIGLTRLVVVLLLAASTFVSEDLTCVAAGVMVGQGRLGFVAATVGCLLGIFVGDLLLFAAGRYLGRPWLRRAPLKWFVKPQAVAASSKWFRERGAMLIFTTRFLPGTRLATYFSAGMLHTPFWRFLLWFLAAAAIWTPLVVGAASFLGAQAFRTFEGARAHLPAIGALVVGLYLLLRLAMSLASWKGRRRLAAWWGRLRRWEFWPPWAFYPPVVAYVGWLALRYRSLTVFTAANPGIPASGFIGESKLDILARLDPRWVGRFQALPEGLSPDERSEQVRRFAAEHGLDFPLVLKPDQGQRGSGVRIVRSAEEVQMALAEQPDALVVQEYVEGPEFGVFYVRLPGEEKGRIFAITEKRLPQVVGDGERTLEELILADGRALFAEGAYRASLGERVSEVPPAGASVTLTELGTHCRGAIFLDGAHHWSAELEAAIHELSASFEHFYFGRYDLRAPSVEHFRAGQGLKVLELNGVTSEATSIYDPKNNLFTAYRVLFEQWRLAFEIGHRNRQKGHPVTGLRELAAALVQALQEGEPTDA
ncbi:MAG TPA: alpha/beta fold hydrolase, partial [Thermoanaerobaculia bacterium]|nr:alpha/beta fold hydrolase [Thermoanaerobaculia bacterium]